MNYGRFDDSRDQDGHRDFVKVTRPRKGTTVITMDRPERMNSMAFEQVIPLHAALDEVAHDNDAGVVILTGTGCRILFGCGHTTHRATAEYRRTDTDPDCHAVDVDSGRSRAGDAQNAPAC